MKKVVPKIDLHACLNKHAFEHALISTYTFGARFFEGYALENLKALQNNGNISIIVDDGQYRDLLRLAAENEDFPKQANLRYLLHPIRVPGAFHPKILMLVGKRRGLLIIGSSNLTQDGLGSNAEMVAVFSYEIEKEEETLTLFQAVLGLFEKIAERWSGEQLASNMDTLKGDALWLSNPSRDPPPPGLPVLLHNLERPLWDQMVEGLPKSATHLSVLSRYFDAKPSMLENLMKTAGISATTVYTQNRTTTLSEDWITSSFFKRGDLQIQLCSYADEDYYQRLHGKAYAFECGAEIVYAIGSANFTTPALRRTAKDGNVEILICYPPLPADSYSPKGLFDPQGSGVKLETATQLITAPEKSNDHDMVQDVYSLSLSEAIVEDDSLKLRILEDDVPNHAICLISQANSRPFKLRVIPADCKTLRATLDVASQKRLRDAPAIAQLVEGPLEKWTPLSNQMFVTNLQDITTGLDVRRERQIREARESPQRFIDVLTALSSSENEERLKLFLTHCNIPIDLPVRNFHHRKRALGITDAHLEAFRMLGSRNLKQFAALHDAVMDFVDRHRRCLDQHIERGTAKGIPNFLHILLTIGNLLLSQIQRVIAGLESEQKVQMEPDRWHNVRCNLDGYYKALEELLQLTVVDYLDAMTEGGSLKKIREEFGDGVQDLATLYEHAIKNRDILDALQRSRLEIVSPGRRIQGPGFFVSLLAPVQWTPFLSRIRRLQSTLSQRIAS